MLVSHENTRLPKYLFISLSNLKRGYLATKGQRNRCFVISPIKNEKHMHLQLHVPVAERQKCKHCHKIFCVIDICHRCFPQNCFHWPFATKVVGIRVNIGGMSCTLCGHMYRLIFQKRQSVSPPYTMYIFWQKILYVCYHQSWYAMTSLLDFSIILFVFCWWKNEPAKRGHSCQVFEVVPAHDWYV